MKRFIRICAALVCVLYGFDCASVVSQTVAPIVASNDNFVSKKHNFKIKIIGNKRIENGTIAEKVYALNYYGEFSPAFIDSVIKKLFSTGFFAAVDVYADNDVLCVKVDENPIVAEYAFEGNKAVSDDNFNKFFQDELKSRTVFSLSKIKYLTTEIINVYRQRGYFSVTVNPKIIRLSDNRVNVVFEIKEGKIATVKKVFFVGNRRFDDTTLLAEMSTKETAWWRFWSSDDLFDPARVDTDKRLITEFYKTHGYADFKIESSFNELSEDKESFYITIKMKEGDVYNFGKIDIKSEIKDVTKEELQKLLKIKKSKKFNLKEIEESKYQMAEYLSNKGYVFSSINYDLQLDKDKKIADITFNVDQGDKAYINQIKIEGNMITKDEVIRREMLIQEQDALQADKVAKSIGNIRDLDFFSDVNVMQEKVGQGKANLKIKVNEKSTAMLQLNLGYAIGRGIFTKIGLSEKNFLGEGKYVSGEVMIGRNDKAISGQYIIPYFLNRRLDLGFSAGIAESNRTKTTSAKNKSYSLGSFVTYQLSPKLSHRIGYSFSYDDTKPDSGLQDEKFYLEKIKPITTASEYDALWKSKKRDPRKLHELLCDEFGKRTRSSVYSVLAYSDLDSRINPRDGYVWALRNSYYGVGGDVKFGSHTLTGKYYFPVFDRCVLMVKGEAGIMGKGSYMIDRFSVGGDDVKGFDYDGIGPRIKKDQSVDEEALRGTRYYSGVFAFGVPITEGVGRVRSVTYLMFGSNWKSNTEEKYKNCIYDENKMRVSVGTGVEWMSPLGPIAITYTKAVKKEKYDDTQTLQIGYVIID